MSEGMVKAFIACGWIAAGIASVGNLLVATRTGGLNFPNLILTLVFLGIAYGIYRRSRAAALAMLIIFAAMRVRFYGLAERLAPTHGGSSFMTSFWVSTMIFMSAYLLAVIGTFAWHARQSATARKSLSA
ncbi:MAG: hypothetical protein ABSC63_07830 [Candidatus Binataceae bacterium]|jgi:hypothetical protein